MTVSKRMWYLAAFAAVLALLAAFWFGRPAYRHYKEVRSMRLAQAVLAKGDDRSAFLALRIVLAINSSNVPATRLMADLFDRGQSPAALGWRRRVSELDPGLENRIQFAACALRYEKPPFPIAAQALEEMRSLAESITDYHLVASQLALKLNRLPDAETHLESAARLEPTNRLHQLNLATIRLQSADTNIAAAARGALAALASDPALALPALRSLTADGLARHDWTAAEDCSRRLQTQAEATLEDRFLRLTVLSESRNAQLGPALASVQRECATNSLKVAQAVSWMNGHALARAALDWTATLPAGTRTAQPVPMAEADCYLTLADWSGLQDRLMGRRWDEQEFLRLAFLSRALREQNKRDGAGANWRLALSAASRRPELLLVLLQLTRAWGWTEETTDVLWAIAGRTRSEDWPLRMLMSDYAAKNDSVGIYRVFQALLERHPDSLELKNNVATLGLLLGRDLARSQALAREVYVAAKTNAALVSTYAFALHAQGKTADGLKLMQGFPEAELHRPEIALYYAVLLTAAGEKNEAGPYFAAAEKGQPLPEERRLLEQARKAN
jgi:hypothetical protein